MFYLHIEAEQVCVIIMINSNYFVHVWVTSSEVIARTC